MAKIVFNSVSAKSDKNKEIVPDSDGYYELVIGGLNIFNSAGSYYTLKGAAELFKENSILMRRLKTGFVKAEVGHPKRTAGMSMTEYKERVKSIDLHNVCAHIKEVSLVETKDIDNGSSEYIWLMVGKVKPIEPHGNILKDALDNPDANVAFSIRSITQDDFINGVRVKTLSEVVTWDYVVEPGIYKATKWQTLGIESLELAEYDDTDRQARDELLKIMKDKNDSANESDKEIDERILSMFKCDEHDNCVLAKW